MTYKIVEKENGKFTYKEIDDQGNSDGTSTQEFDTEAEVQAVINTLSISKDETTPGHIASASEDAPIVGNPDSTVEPTEAQELKAD
jgi:hypothetical protein